MVSKIFAEDKDYILKLASHAESGSNHPIALSILRAYKKDIIKEDLKDFDEIFGEGIKVIYKDKILLVGNQGLLEKHNINFEIPEIKHTIIYVSYDKAYIGYIVLEDELKITSKQTILDLKKDGKTNFNGHWRPRFHCP